MPNMKQWGNTISFSGVEFSLTWEKITTANEASFNMELSKNNWYRTSVVCGICAYGIHNDKICRLV